MRKNGELGTSYAKEWGVGNELCERMRKNGELGTSYAKEWGVGNELCERMGSGERVMRKNGEWVRRCILSPLLGAFSARETDRMR